MLGQYKNKMEIGRENKKAKKVKKDKEGKEKWNLNTSNTKRRPK